MIDVCVPLRSSDGKGGAGKIGPVFAQWTPALVSVTVSNQRRRGQYSG